MIQYDFAANEKLLKLHPKVIPNRQTAATNLTNGGGVRLHFQTPLALQASDYSIPNCLQPDFTTLESPQLDDST